MKVVCLALLASFACSPVDTGPGSGSGNAGAGGGPDGGSAAGPAQTPTITVNLAEGQTCKVGHDGNFDVTVSVQNATVNKRGNCGSTTNCGHVALFVDDTACGDPNAESGSTTCTAQFGKCGQIEGWHKVRADLRDDGDHTLCSSATLDVLVKRGGEGGDGEGD